MVVRKPQGAVRLELTPRRKSVHSKRGSSPHRALVRGQSVLRAGSTPVGTSAAVRPRLNLESCEVGVGGAAGRFFSREQQSIFVSDFLDIGVRGGLVICAKICFPFVVCT